LQSSNRRQKSHTPVDLYQCPTRATVLPAVQQHLASFQEFPIRQVGLSASVGKTLETMQSQL
jgi:hypothetical protein